MKVWYKVMSNKIIVIGAGASGLMAASALAKKKHQVTVVEARDRIGGRIYTSSRSFTLPLEMGAEFMHGKQPLTRALIKKSLRT